MKVLVVESDREAAQSFQKTLEEYCIVDIASCPQEGEYLALFDCFDLIILDEPLRERLKNERLNASFLILHKPFNISAIVQSVRPTGTICAADLTLDLHAMTASRNGDAIALRRKEFFILEYLMRHAGHAVTRQAILDRAWGTYEEAGSNLVDVHIKYLRDKIDKPYRKKLLATIRGVGYRIEE